MNIVIMGATSGIGLAVAEALASRGIKIGAAGRRLDRLEQLAGKYPGFVEVMQIDICSSEAPKRLEQLAAKLGGMDMYFHVSGIGYDNLGLDPDTDAAIIDTNTGALARMVTAAYRYFRSEGKHGHIAALTSVAGCKPLGAMAAYSASKAGAQTFIAAMAQLSRRQGSGVTFTDIRPGWISTPLLHPDTSYMMEMPLDYVVPKVIRALVRRPRVAYIDWRWHAAMLAAKSVPMALWQRLDIPFSKKR